MISSAYIVFAWALWSYVGFSEPGLAGSHPMRGLHRDSGPFGELTWKLHRIEDMKHDFHNITHICVMCV